MRTKDAAGLKDVPRALPAPSEMEVKFRASPETQHEILNSPLLAPATGRSTEQLETTYFDTDELALRKAGIDLRIRRENGRKRILCFKGAPSPSNPFVRTEIEAETRYTAPVLALLPEQVARQVEATASGAPLKPRFRTKIVRQACLLRWKTSDIEIACDVGEVMAGRRSRLIGEVELELVAGSSADLFDLAKVCAGHFALTLDFASKSAKGHLLASQSLPLPRKGAAPDLAAAATGSDVIAVLLQEALSHFTANWQALRDTEAPEAIHQLRVSLRRLRCFLAFIPKPEQDDRATGFRRRARDLSAAFSAARGWDVFQEFLVKGPLATPLPGAPLLLGRLKEFRLATYARAREAIDSREASLLVLDLHAYIAARGWESETPISEIMVARIEAPTFAAQTLERLQARARKRGRKIETLDAIGLHELRIALKALRYGAEALRPVIGKRKRLRKLLDLTAHLQEVLGQRNDASQFTQHLQELSNATGPKAQAASAYVAGWLARLASEGRAELHRAWRDIKDLDTDWV